MKTKLWIRLVAFASIAVSFSLLNLLYCALFTVYVPVVCEILMLLTLAIAGFCVFMTFMVVYPIIYLFVTTAYWICTGTWLDSDKWMGWYDNMPFGF
jgi:hypothetical protein